MKQQSRLTEQRTILYIGIASLLLNCLQYKAILAGNLIYIIAVLISLLVIGYSLSLLRKNRN